MRRASVDTSRPDLRHLAERIAAELDSGRGADVSGGLRRDPGHRSGQRARRAAADPGDPGDVLQHPAPAKGEHVTAVAGPASVGAGVVSAIVLLVGVLWVIPPFG